MKSRWWGIRYAKKIASRYTNLSELLGVGGQVLVDSFQDFLKYISDNAQDLLLQDYENASLGHIRISGQWVFRIVKMNFEDRLSLVVHLINLLMNCVPRIHAHTRKHVARKVIRSGFDRVSSRATDFFWSRRVVWGDVLFFAATFLWNSDRILLHDVIYRRLRPANHVKLCVGARQCWNGGKWKRG